MLLPGLSSLWTESGLADQRGVNRWGSRACNLSNWPLYVGHSPSSTSAIGGMLPAYCRGLFHGLDSL